MKRTETYLLNMGPQHPSTHGVLQVKLTLDGERILRAEPVLGYLHRGIEKLLETRTYVQGLPYTDRLDYVSSMNNNFGFARAVEELAGIEVPRRAEFIRVIMAELNRINSHLVGIGSLANDLGASTGMLCCFRDREYILDIFNEVCGARQTFHYIRIGGVSGEFTDKARADRAPPRARAALPRGVRQPPDGQRYLQAPHRRHLADDAGGGARAQHDGAKPPGDGRRARPAET